MANNWITENDDDYNYYIKQTHLFNLVAPVLVSGQFRQRVKERKSIHLGTSPYDCRRRPAGQAPPVFERSINPLQAVQKDSIFMYRRQVVFPV